MASRRQFVKGLAAAAGVASAPRLAFAQGDAPIRIGFCLARTGIFAPAIHSQHNAYEFWKDKVNAEGGLQIGGAGRRRIEYVSYDDQSIPSQAAKIYEKLITQDKVDLLLAPWGTPFHIAVAPVIERFKFPLIGNTAASVTLRDMKPGNIWFVTAAFPDRVGRELAALLTSRSVRSVALLTNVLPFGKEVKRALVPALTAAGIEIRLDDEYPPDINDMTALLAKVKQAKPDAVLALSYPGDSALYVRQAKELAIAAPFQFVLIGPAAAFFTKSLGSAADNLVTVGHWTPKRSRAAQAFSDAYTAKFNERPDFLNTIDPYVSCEVLERAVSEAGLDKNKLREVITRGRFETVMGDVQFQGVENVATRTSFLQVQNGTPEMIWPLPDATAAYQPKTAW
jgi:branched-chain amino acid transport system substrate-binding protein